METKEARYDAAVALKDEDKIAEAIAAMEQLCVDFPDYALPHAALSMWYRRREDFEKSLEHASRVCELEPEDPFSFTALSVLALHSGNHELAEEALNKARMARLQFIEAERQREAEAAAKAAAEAEAAETDAETAQADDAPAKTTGDATDTTDAAAADTPEQKPE